VYHRAGENTSGQARFLRCGLSVLLLKQRFDDAVLLAYGWSDLAGQLRTPDGDEELLRRLLALNLERAGASGS